MKNWNDPQTVNLFALMEISKRGKVGVVMTSATSRRALISARNKMAISARGGQSFEIWEFIPKQFALREGGELRAAAEEGAKA